MDYIYEASKIICEHTNAYLQAVHAEYDNNRDMMEDMYENCAFILSDHLIKGNYTPMQFAAIRNELGKMIWNIFEAHVNAEYDAEKEV